MKQDSIRTLITFAIGFGILYYILENMGGIGRILELLGQVRIEYFLIAGLFYFVNEVLATRILKIALEGVISTRRALSSHMCGMLYSSLTPGRVGYYYTAFSLSKKTHESRSKNIGVLTLIQGVMFFVKVFACLLSVIYFSRLIINSNSLYYLVLASLFPLLIVLGTFLVLYTDLLNRFMGKIPLVKAFLGKVSDMQEASRNVSKEQISQIIIINLLGWLMMSAQWFFLALSLGLDMTFIDALMLNPLLSAVMFFPLTPSGLGVTEFGSALLFRLILSPMDPVQAGAMGVTFLLLVRINSIMVDSLGLIDMKMVTKDSD